MRRLGLVLAAFAAAEVLRDAAPAVATLLSMAGWTGFGWLALDWQRDRAPWPVFWRRLGRIALATAAAAGVQIAYLLHSHILEAGVHVDAVWTFVGLQWFLDLANPITFIGRTPSYGQFPLMLLPHLPGVLVGVDRLGPLAPNLGVLLTFATLLGIVAERLARDAPIAVQAGVAALAAAVLSNRFVVSLYDLMGYPAPALGLGLAVVLLADDEAGLRAERAMGGLLALALVGFFTGWAFVLPLTAAWVLARRGALAAARRFVTANPVVVAAVGVAAVSLTVHPGLLLNRVQDVSVGALEGGGLVGHLVAHASDNARILVDRGARTWWANFVTVGAPSWHQVDHVPPLGGVVLPCVLATWAASLLAFPHRPARWLARFAALAGGVLALALVQRLLSDLADYRDTTPLLALMAAGLAFVFRLPHLDGPRRTALLAVALLVAGANWRDLPVFRGHRYATDDYAWRAGAAFEHLRALASRGTLERLGATRVAVLADRAFVPMQRLYVPALAARGLDVRVLTAEPDCTALESAVVRLATERCEALLVVRHPDVCAPEPAPPGVARNAPVLVDRLEATCPCLGATSGRVCRRLGTDGIEARAPADR